MAIYETATGWQIKVMRNGHRFVDFVKGKDMKELAEAIEAQAIADMKKGLKPKGGTLKHGTVLTLRYGFDETWEFRWKDKSADYQKKVLQYWKSIEDYFTSVGIHKLEQLDTLTIDGYIGHLKEIGNKPKTINNKLNALSAILTLMVERSHLKGLPVIHWAKVKKNDRVRYFSPWEEEQILAAAGDMSYHASWINDMLQDFIVLLFDTGMRPWKEAHQIRPNWVRFDSNGTRVVRVPKEFSKNGESREIPLTGRVTRLLTERMRGLKPDERVFGKLDYKWHCVEFWNQLLRPAMGWGEEEVWYCMRHTFATRLVEYGVNLKVIQELMGHRCITQTARYAKASSSSMAQGIAALEAGLNAAREGQQMGDNRGITLDNFADNQWQHSNVSH